MNPCYLEPDELNYELMIRGIYNVGNSRTRTAALSKALSNEKNGVSSFPVNCGDLFSSSDEINVCEIIYNSILSTNIDSRQGSEGVIICSSRLTHLIMRLDRITAKTDQENERLVKLISCAKETYQKLNNIPIPSPRSPENITRIAQPPENAVARRSTENMSKHFQSSNENVDRASTEGAVGVSAIGSDPMVETLINFQVDQMAGSENYRRSWPGGPVRKSTGAVPKRVQPNRVPTPDTFSNFPNDFQRNESLFEERLISPQERIDIRHEMALLTKDRVNPHPPKISNSNQRDSVPFSVYLENQETTAIDRPHYVSMFNAQQVVQSNRPAVQQIVNEKDQSKETRYAQQQYHRYDRVEGQQIYEPQVRKDVPLENDRLYNNHAGRFETRDAYDVNRRVFDRSPKYVPVHQWKIFFSGDGKGLHLYDFLSQIAMYRRSEQVSDEEMLASIVHLLVGRARLWYQAEFDLINTWADLVSGLKNEFLPPNYNFVLLNDISNRAQKPHESFAEYMTHMQSLFKWVSIDLSESHKLFIVQKNLLPKYAIGVASRDIRTLTELSQVCRRMDGVFRQAQLQIPFQEIPNMQYSRTYPKPREVHELLYNSNSNEQHFEQPTEYGGELECCEIRRRGNHDNNRYGRRFCETDRSEQEPSAATRVLVCWNCSQNGHSYLSCSQPRNKKFCYRCGKPDVIVTMCPKCQGNERGNSVTQSAEPNAPDAQA